MNYDVVIIGAGPSGLALACLLAEKKLKIAIIEKNNLNKFSKPQNDGRDIALTHRSINILEKIGINKFINTKSISTIKEARVLDGNSPYYLQFDHKRTSKNNLGYLISSQIIKKALYRKLKSLKKIKIFTNCEVSKINNKNLYSEIYLKNKKIFKTKLTVIADGRLSKIRKKLGIHSNITNFKTSMTVFRMKHEINNKNIASEYFHYSQTIAILPIKKNLSSIVVTLPNNELKNFLLMDKKKLNNEIENNLKFKLGKMNLIGKKFTYPMITVFSSEFYRDRCVLIGDAAVGMHPVTAHGFNLNLRGIDILNNQINHALTKNKDIAETEILKSYENKFKKVSLPIYLATNGLVKLYTSQKPIIKLARKSLLRIANITWPIKNALIDNLLIKNS